MHPGLSQRASGMTVPQSAGFYERKKRNSIMVTVSLLVISVLILIIGVAATTRTQNVTVGGYYPGVILVASIVFISFGVVASFCCAIVDGVFAARHIDLRPLYAGRCHYYSSVEEKDVPCQMSSRASCSLKVKSNTCYCCDLYICGKSRSEPGAGYHEYVDVQSCQDVIHLYHLLWFATILNIVALFLGIVTAAVLGGFKDMGPPLASCEPETLPAPMPCEPQQQVTPYSSYSAPHLPPYTAYDLQNSIIFPAATPSGLSDDSQSGSSYMWASHAPPRYSPPYFSPDEKPPPYSP
ncbi:transmembrane protein 255A-like [Acipenser oxyrinchus oxyrinchus]|uniref:Transmembrane protein 255A n=1 Tax=Acipenser oxyrinchus oxyrinchus TaxID=40147 RepID=A0AAD8FZK9_ACIOX|nr:transmembrane protein 255A-like [Acipenser oxyrinchus oxyrinchus]